MNKRVLWKKQGLLCQYLRRQDCGKLAGLCGRRSSWYGRYDTTTVPISESSPAFSWNGEELMTEA